MAKNAHVDKLQQLLMRGPLRTATLLAELEVSRANGFLIWAPDSRLNICRFATRWRENFGIVSWKTIGSPKRSNNK
jgi:hypothetical protein